MKDAILSGTLIFAFAGAVLCQLALVLGLARRRPRTRALWATLFPPLAPYWGWGEQMRVRVIGWLVSVGVYAVARLLVGG